MIKMKRAKPTKEEMNEWLQNTYGVTLRDVENATLDDAIMCELINQDCDDLEENKLYEMAGRVLDYLAAPY